MFKQLSKNHEFDIDNMGKIFRVNNQAEVDDENSRLIRLSGNPYPKMRSQALQTDSQNEDI